MHLICDFCKLLVQHEYFLLHELQLGILGHGVDLGEEGVNVNAVFNEASIPNVNVVLFEASEALIGSVFDAVGVFNK